MLILLGLFSYITLVAVDGEKRYMQKRVGKEGKGGEGAFSSCAFFTLPFYLLFSHYFPYFEFFTKILSKGEVT